MSTSHERSVFVGWDDDDNPSGAPMPMGEHELVVIRQQEEAGYVLRDVQREAGGHRLVFRPKAANEDSASVEIQAEGGVPAGFEQAVNQDQYAGIFAVAFAKNDFYAMFYYRRLEDQEGFPVEVAFRVEARSPSACVTEIDGWEHVSSMTRSWTEVPDDGLEVTFDLLKSSTEPQPDFNRHLEDTSTSVPPSREEGSSRPSRVRRVASSISRTFGRIFGSRKDATSR